MPAPLYIEILSRGLQGATGPAGDAGAPTQYQSDFLVGVVYVGIAPIGVATADAQWEIFKVVEADNHPVKTASGLNAWDDRYSLTYT